MNTRGHYWKQKIIEKQGIMDRGRDEKRGKEIEGERNTQTEAETER